MKTVENRSTSFFPDSKMFGLHQSNFIITLHLQQQENYISKPKHMHTVYFYKCLLYFISLVEKICYCLMTTHENEKKKQRFD